MIERTIKIDGHRCSGKTTSALTLLVIDAHKNPDKWVLYQSKHISAGYVRYVIHPTLQKVCESHNCPIPRNIDFHQEPGREYSLCVWDEQ